MHINITLKYLYVIKIHFSLQWTSVFKENVCWKLKKHLNFALSNICIEFLTNTTFRASNLSFFFLFHYFCFICMIFMWVCNFQPRTRKKNVSCPLGFFYGKSRMRWRNYDGLSNVILFVRSTIIPGKQGKSRQQPLCISKNVFKSIDPCFPGI